MNKLKNSGRAAHPLLWTLGVLVVRAERAVGTLPILQATKPQAVLLDLDLPDEAAWQIAELVLSEACSPEVILLTGRTAQFDIRTAIRAGSLVSKSESPECVLELIEQKLELPEAQELAARLMRHLFENVSLSAMPVQDAIDLARFMVETTIGFMRFAVMRQPKVVGGPVEIGYIGEEFVLGRGGGWDFGVPGLFTRYGAD